MLLFPCSVLILVTATRGCTQQIVPVLICLYMHDRYNGLVPAEWISAGLIRPRPQTQSLSRGLPELHVPVWGPERFAGAERLLEVEFQQPHVDFPQKVSRYFICQCICQFVAVGVGSGPQLNIVLIVQHVRSHDFCKIVQCCVTSVHWLITFGIHSY